MSSGNIFGWNCPAPPGRIWSLGEGGDEVNHFCAIQSLSYFASWRDQQCNLGNHIAALEIAPSLEGDVKEDPDRHFAQFLHWEHHPQLWQRCTEAGVSPTCSEGAQRAVALIVKLGTSFPWQDNSFQEQVFIRNISFQKNTKHWRSGRGK